MPPIHFRTLRCTTRSSQMANCITSVFHAGGHGKNTTLGLCHNGTLLWCKPHDAVVPLGHNVLKLAYSKKMALGLCPL